MLLFLFVCFFLWSLIDESIRGGSVVASHSSLSLFLEQHPGTPKSCEMCWNRFEELQRVSRTGSSPEQTSQCLHMFGVSVS